MVDFKSWFRSCDEHTRRPLSGLLVHVGDPAWEPAWVSRSLQILLVFFFLVERVALIFIQGLFLVEGYRKRWTGIETTIT